MFNKGKTRTPSTKTQKKATLVLVQALSENYIKVAEDAVKTDDVKFQEELRDYTIKILNQAEQALLILNNKLHPEGV